jgi:radical SAM protein with 4Fe4S-binding SPASM domain
LDKIVIAIDGISDEIYKKYRRNGDLQLVISNLKKIIHYKEVFRSTIKIEWQMIDFEWNKSEQLSAKQLSNQLGCDEFRIISNDYRKRFWSDSDYIRRKNCIHPYFTFLVNAYNKVRPCPVVYNVDVTIGDLNTESINEVWNGSEIRRIRSRKKIQLRNGCKTCKI